MSDIMSFSQAQRLARLQSRLWGALAEALREDGHRKSSDGQIEVTFTLPPAFDWDARPSWQVTIWSYVLCEGGRSKTFDAPTFEGALSQAEAYATRICMSWEFRRFDRGCGGPDPDDTLPTPKEPDQ